MAERNVPHKDYYEILGLSEDASRDEIVRAYQQLAQAFDPEGDAGDPTSVIFQDVFEAHAVLSDDELRERYDEARRIGAPPPPLPPPPEARKEEPAARNAWAAFVANWDTAVVVAVAGCLLFLALGFGFKAACMDDFGNDAYRITCYNDLQPLFASRLFDTDGDRVFPYINADETDVDGDGGSDLVNGAIEYPVLTGVFMYLSGLLADDPNSFLSWSAFFLFPFGLIVAYMLARMTAWRALLWSFAPAIILYSFHNWDLLVVAAAVGGIYLWWKKEPIWAAVLFGIGGAFKLYPIFFLAPLALEMWVKEEKREAIRAAIAGGGTLLAVNLPFMIANFEGWSITYTFHERRGPNFDTIWCTLRDNCLAEPFWQPSTLNTVTAVLTGAFFIGALGFGWMRAQKEGRYPFIQVCGALLAAFLLWNKVHSPQYTLWLIPFFVLIRVHFLWWVGYAIADLMVYIGVFRWFYSFGFEQDFPALDVMEAGIWSRAALLLTLFVVFLRSDAAHETAPSRVFALKEWLTQPLRRAEAERA
jgi:uncharacterized membrane protein